MIQPPYNPYAPPYAEGARGPSAGERAAGEWIKWGYVAASISLFMLWIGRAAGIQRADVGVSYVGFVQLLVIAAWVFQSWNGVPAPFRSGVSPSGALGRFLVPLFNLYWFFVVNVRLCRALDAALVSTGRAPRAPRTFAMLAPPAHVLIAFVRATLPFAPAIAAKPSLSQGIGAACALALDILWFVYMLRCDDVRREVARTTPRTDRLVWPSLLFLLLPLGFLLFLAIWTFLSPIPAPH